MKLKLEVLLAENTGIPFARVPRQAMWELVEYLSSQRVHVSYAYAADHFTVHFLNSDSEKARALLNEWAASEYEAMIAHQNIEHSDWIVGMTH